MKRGLRVSVVVVALVAFAGLAGYPLGAQRAVAPAASRNAANAYFPDRFGWQHKSPDEVGMDPALLKVAVDAAVAADTPGPHDTREFLENSFGKEAPYDAIVGPVHDRGPASGLIARHGYIVAEWGEPSRVEVSNSVTKTFLTTVVGLAWQKGLIADVNDCVRDYMPPNVDLFTAEHNRTITWDHLLRQTSDWSGTLWGKPDWADRPVGATPAEWEKRPMYEPGTHFKYNDVRVNVLSLAALNVWRRPLPDVLREEVMNPIGASSTWRWYAYDNCLGRTRRPADPVGARRRPLGRRHVHQFVRHGALWLSVPARREVERQDDRLGQVDQDGADAGQRQPDLRFRQLVPEHRSQAAAVGAGHRRPLRRQRVEHHLHRLGQRHRRDLPLDEK